MTTPLAERAIAAVGLHKSYGDKAVLNGIDLDVAAGTVFALLGPNGAGKTTALQILTTLLRPDGGTARVAGHDVVREAAMVRRAIGVTGQLSAVDGLLTGRENLRLMADLAHLDRPSAARRVVEMLDLLDLADAAEQMAATYSGGMQRPLDLAMTLIGEPSIIFLDEPTTGLDPRSRRAVWVTVRELVASGVTVFLTTQYLEEADKLADRIALLDGGRIVAEGSAAELKRLVPGGHIRLRFDDPVQLDAAVHAFPDSAPDEDAMTLDIPAGDDVGSLRVVLDRLDRRAIRVDGLDIHSPDLDDVFLALTGQPQSTTGGSR